MEGPALTRKPVSRPGSGILLSGSGTSRVHPCAGGRVAAWKGFRWIAWACRWGCWKTLIDQAVNAGLRGDRKCWRYGRLHRNKRHTSVTEQVFITTTRFRVAKPWFPARRRMELCLVVGFAVAHRSIAGTAVARRPSSPRVKRGLSGNNAIRASVSAWL